MSKATMSDISKILSNDKKSTDFHYYGTVESINEDGTYDVSINHTEDITVTAAKLVGAHVGDTVMVTVMSNGYATVTGCLGGDKDSVDAKEVAEEAKEKADEATKDVQSDWLVTNSEFSNYIRNKPYINSAISSKSDDDMRSNVENDLVNNIVDSAYSHAEGCGTTIEVLNATGSHAEGYETKIVEDDYLGGTKGYAGAHVEGYQTKASQLGAHAEGVITEVSVEGGHAEGWSTKATGRNQEWGEDRGAHAEGCDTEADGNGCHAEGGYTYAVGNCSHTEGYNTKAYYGSHAEGYSTIAGVNEGDVLTYYAAHAEGYNTEATGPASHSQGYNTLAVGRSSFAGGHSTVANGDNQMVIGYLNQPDLEGKNGKYAFIIGNGTGKGIVGEDNPRNIFTVDWNGNVFCNADLSCKKIHGQFDIDESTGLKMTRKGQLYIDLELLRSLLGCNQHQ